MTTKPISIFSAIGIELEYMLVHQDTLEPAPIADQLIKKLAGVITNELDYGEISISNELALHVIELKTNGPKKSLDNLDIAFHQCINYLQSSLRSFGVTLLPTGTHPWLDPSKDIKLWPHGNRKIYESYHRIFNCSGHGWGNLQSTHLNFPFASDEEFAKLHNAIRLLLPILPALTASTPISEGKVSGSLDTRLLFYGKNQQKIPCIAGDIIPEFITSQQMYLEDILHPMYRAIAADDLDNVLQHEWLNSRGAITRFDRNAIEIRILDIQECPLADIAVASVINSILKYLIHNTDNYLRQPLPTASLKKIYEQCIQSGMGTQIEDKDFLEQFGLATTTPRSIGSLLAALIEKASANIESQYQSVAEFLLNNGSLAERLLKSLDNHAHPTNIKPLYDRLAECLATNQLYTSPSR